MMDVNKEVICKIKIGRSFKFPSVSKKKEFKAKGQRLKDKGIRVDWLIKFIMIIG